MTEKEERAFETQNVDLASFLIMEGITFLGCKKSPRNPKVIILSFANEKRNCFDLERVFIGSDFKRYRDINKWLLDKIHDTIRGEYSGESNI